MAKTDLRERVLGAAKWSGIGLIAVRMISLTSNIVLARLLAPADFGIVGMATLVTGVITNFAEIGVSAAIIYKSDADNHLIDVAHTLNVITGIVAFVVGVGLGPVTAAYFGKPILSLIVMVFSINFAINGFLSMALALLQKSFDFKTRAISSIASEFIYIAVGTIMAVSGFGLWSLVISRLIASVAGAVYVFIHTERIPRLSKIDRQATQGLVNYGKYFLGAGIISYVFDNIDYLVIAKTLGETLLGVYMLAYNLISYPVQLVAYALGRLAFPLFAKLQSDRAALENAYNGMSALIAFISLPAFAELLAIADPLVRFLYGEKWGLAALPLQILVLQGAVRTLTAGISDMYNAVGRTDQSFRLTFIQLLVVVPTVLLFGRWGIGSVAMAMSISFALVRAYGTWSMYRCLGFSLRGLLASLIPSAVATSMMLVVVEILLWGSWVWHVPAGLQVVTAAVVGVGCYFGFFRILYPGQFRSNVALTLEPFMKQKAGTAETSA